MMTVEEWKQGLAAWKKIKHQAEIDLEQTELFIPIFEEKIKELEAEKHGE